MKTIKKFKPKTSGTRFRTILSYKRLNKNKLEKNLIKGFNRKFGRNNQGRITVKCRGGGNKIKYRYVLFKRVFFSGVVTNFEYDPNRTAFLAKIYSFNKNCFYYILSPKGLNIGDAVKSYKYNQKFKKLSIGDSLILKNIPVGSLIHNIELKPGKGGQLVRTAGNFSQIIEKIGNFARLRFKSGEQRLISLNCFASIGIIGNEDFRLTSIGKAGSNRWLGRRPIVRGVAKNPVDHPHGGGQGKTSGGRPSVTFNGRITKGQPTRKRPLNKNIIFSARDLRILKKKSTRKGKFTY